MTIASAKATNSSSRTTATSTQHCCDLCGCKRFELLCDFDRRGEKLTTVICWRCGLVQHGVIPTDDELAQYYEQEYRSDYNGEETPSAKRVVREWKRGRERFELVRPFLNSDDRVFEIGSGIGCNLKHFELAGHEAAGIEPGAGFAAFSRTRMHCDVRQGIWQDEPPVPTYDLVLLIHVLEHLNSPTRALRHIHDMLRPGGRLYIEVPNLAAPHAAPKRLFHYAHIYNFTPWTLSMLGQSCGFEVTKILSAERDRNLMMVLTRSESCSREIDSESYLKTLAAVRRYNTLTYHLRANYLVERFNDIVRYAKERRTAAVQFDEIMRICDQHEASKIMVAAHQSRREAA